MSQSTEAQPTSLTALLASIFAQASSPPPPPPPGSSSSDQEDPALRLLGLIKRTNDLANSLSLFSDNDSLEDLPTGTLRALFIHSVWAEIESNVRTMGDLQGRRQRLLASRSHYLRFLKTLFDLDILPKNVPSSSSSSSSSSSPSPIGMLATLIRPLCSPEASSSSSATASGSLPTNPHQRREFKVALFKLERALKNSLDEYRLAAREKSKATQGGGLSMPGLGASTGPSQDANEQPDEAQWDLLVLPRKSKAGSAEQDDEDDDEEEDQAVFVSGSGSNNQSSSSKTPANAIATPTSLRSYLLQLLQLHALLAYNNLASMDDEIQLLSNIPASAERDAAERKAQEEAETERRRRGGEGDDFRLDRRFDSAAPGPLMDGKGKPLRPFTITNGQASAGASSSRQTNIGGTPVHDLDERQRIRDGVFKPSHRLPTMTIDEYLAEEEARGNILRGGGHEGAAKATPREARSLRAENDGTVEAEEALEEARQEAIQWDEFKESNKKGAGNTMNRG